MKFSAELKRRRLAAGMTVRDIDKATGISNSMISMYEMGSSMNMSFKNAILISKLLGWRLSSMATALERQSRESKERG